MTNTNTPMLCQALVNIRQAAGHTFRDVASLAECSPLDVQAMEKGDLLLTQEVLNAYGELARRSGLNTWQE